VCVFKQLLVDLVFLVLTLSSVMQEEHEAESSPIARFIVLTLSSVIQEEKFAEPTQIARFLVPTLNRVMQEEHEAESSPIARFIVLTLSSVMQEEHEAESSPLVGSSKNITGGLLTSSGKRMDKGYKNEGTQHVEKTIV
jgi:hypothetical protein